MSAGITYKARLFAEACDKLAAMRAFSASSTVADAAPDTVRMEWNSGSATTGYKELSHAMSIIAAQRWVQIRDEAIAQQQVLVNRLHTELRAELAEWSCHA